jgi:hypothetical protein
MPVFTGISIPKMILTPADLNTKAIYTPSTIEKRGGAIEKRGGITHRRPFIPVTDVLNLGYMRPNIEIQG